MAISRRLLMKGFFGALATMASPFSGLWASTGQYQAEAAVPIDPEARLSLERFEAFLNADFHVLLGDTAYFRVRLKEVSSRVTVPVFVTGQCFQQESFSVLFEGAYDSEFSQEIYCLVNPRFGSFSAFLVPVGHTSHTASYQAVFNRLV